MEEIKIITNKFFDDNYSCNWMATNYNGKYTHLPNEKLVITECKNTEGNLSNMPFVAIDNSELNCILECFATLEEAISFLQLKRG